MKREPILGGESEGFLDIVKCALLIVLIWKFGVPMMDRAWENKDLALDFIWKVYGL